MKLLFFKLSDYSTLSKAQSAKAVRSLHIEDSAKQNLLTGAAADAVEAVVTAVSMMDEAERIQFILVTDDMKILDTLEN